MTAQQTFLMLWNPATFRGFTAEIPILQAEIRTSGTVDDWWSTGFRMHGIEPGDRVFLVGTAVKPWSVIASGKAAGPIHHPPRHSASGTPYVNRVAVEWEHVLDQQHTMPIPENEQELYDYVTKRQASGNTLRPDLAETLSRYWELHLKQFG